MGADTVRSPESLSAAQHASDLVHEAGVQAMFLSGRPSHVSEERFHYHYRWIHGELARETLSRPNGGLMNRYVQSHRIGVLDGLAPLELEALGEAWFDSDEDQQTSYTREAFLHRIVPDETRFADPTRTIWFATRSRIVRRAGVLPPAAARIVVAVARREDDPARGRWDDRAVQVGRTPGVLEVVQADVVAESPLDLADGGVRPESGWTALEMLTFADVFEIDRGWPLMRDAYLEQLAEVADVERCAAFVASVQRVF
jgi:hypothetical protein